MGPSNVRSAHARQALPAAPAGEYVSLTVGKFIERTGHSTVSTSAAVALAGGGYLGRARKVLPDDRDEVERAFPEMFVDELNKRGWTDVEHTPVSVLNPSHPEFIGDKSKVQRG